MMEIMTKDIVAWTGAVLAGLGFAFRTGKKTKDIESRITQNEKDTRSALHGLKEVVQSMATRDDLDRTINQFDKTISDMHSDLKQSITESHNRIDQIYTELPKRKND